MTWKRLSHLLIWASSLWSGLWVANQLKNKSYHFLNFDKWTHLLKDAFVQVIIIYNLINAVFSLKMRCFVTSNYLICITRKTQKNNLNQLVFWCWHLCYLSQLPEGMDCQRVSLYHFALKTFIGTLTSIIETKFSQIFRI